MELKQTNKVRHIITLTTGQYDHLYNIMCSQDEIIDYLNESDDFELSEDEYLAIQDNELSLFDILDNRFTNDRLNIYIQD